MNDTKMICVYLYCEKNALPQALEFSHLSNKKFISAIEELISDYYVTGVSVNFDDFETGD